MKKVVISNQKGGVGKTTIGLHMAYRLVEMDRRVLYLDIDPQGNSSKTLAAFTSPIVASALFDPAPIALPGRDGITLIRADERLVALERADPAVIQHFVNHISALSAAAFDICIIDTPPTMGLRMTAALIVADYVLSPIELEEYSIDGIERLLKAVIGVKSQYNPHLNFLGMLPNRFNGNSLRQKAAMEHLLKKFSRYLIPAKIGNRAGIPEALAAGMPVWKMNKTASREAGKEFKAVLELIFQRMGEDA